MIDPELDQLKSSVQSHHKRLRDIEEYLHFPPDYGPSDHVHCHVASRETTRRKADLQAQIIKSTVWLAVLFVLGLLAMGINDWVRGIASISGGF